MWSRLVCTGLLACGLGQKVLADDYLIGTYYFPGWTDGAAGLQHLPRPWQPIKSFPEREPLLGWYSDSDPAVLKQQVDWMAAYGIGFVAFDWYWDGRKPYLTQAVGAFKQIDRPKDFRYALMWANHYPFVGGMDSYRAMVSNWIDQHLRDAGYLKIDGRPVVFVFSIEAFDEAAAAIGVPPAQLIEVADRMAAKAGIGPIYFVAGTAALSHWVNRVGPAAGFSALSGYNYHNSFAGSRETASPGAEGYDQFDRAYRNTWRWISDHSELPYIVPFLSGWDHRPWGASQNPRHDRSIATAAQFESHLRAGKELMDAKPTAAGVKMAVICCWNEYGEGSYIEPTRQDGFRFLEAVRRVFPKNAAVQN